MAEEPEIILPIPPTLKEKLTFYVTAFFLLLCIFSAFAFLFLVPFIIEPAYTTIKMDFDEEAAQCVTASTESRHGLSNCTWTSCREGCTREIYECTQILVNYKHPNIPNLFVLDTTNVVEENVAVDGGAPSEQDNYDSGAVGVRGERLSAALDTRRGGIGVEYDQDGYAVDESENVYVQNQQQSAAAIDEEMKKYKWFYGARLFPNVKGCGYPPYLNCTIFYNTYAKLGANFTCYYSRADPSLVVSGLDMRQEHFYLICSLAIPIISFVVSAIYLLFAYFYIYNDPTTAKSTPCKRVVTKTNNVITAAAVAAAAAVSVNSSINKSNTVHITPLALSTPIAPPTSGILTPASDILFQDDENSFGNEYKYAMVDDMISRDSFDSMAFNYSSSMNGNLNKMMTTCILTPPGPIAQL